MFEQSPNLEANLTDKQPSLDCKVALYGACEQAVSKSLGLANVQPSRGTV